MKIDGLEIEYTNHRMVTPLQIGDKPPMKDITRLVVNATVDGVRGVGEATLADVWAGADLEEMKAYASALQARMRGMDTENPLELYKKMVPTMLADSDINKVAQLIVWAGFYNALWDAYGKMHEKHPCLMLGEVDKRYAGIFLPMPRKKVYLEYTYGGASKLLGERGLLAAKHQRGYRVVKVKCGGDPEEDFKKMMAIYAATGCQLWPDFNGSGTPEGVKQLCNALKACLRQGELLAVEQPFSVAETFKIDIHGMGHVPFFLDESAVMPEDILAAKALGYLGIVVKADKGGLSHVAEMVRVAKEHRMLVSVQDLTSDPWPSLGIAAYLRDLHGHIAEMNQIELLVTPKPVVIQNGCVDTSQLTGPGFYP